ncbi:MAG: CPBP family glutamic-type intramembrane protease, partial [Bryobacteraceae bacterium]
YWAGWGKGLTLTIVGAFLALAAIDIPLGMWLHFLHWAPGRGWRILPLTWLGILIFTAWPEEFIFRGLLQNLLSRNMRNEYAGWIAASILFGFAHITNGGFPNWKYVFLASIAGFIYGWVWRKTGSLFASAMVHAFVDTIWHVLFR